MKETALNWPEPGNSPPEKTLYTLPNVFAFALTAGS